MAFVAIVAAVLVWPRRRRTAGERPVLRPTWPPATGRAARSTGSPASGPEGRKALDDYSSAFRPERKITRRQLARALVIASGHQDDLVTPIDIPDVVPGIDPDYWYIQIAVSLGFMAAAGDGFHPDNTVTASKAEAAVVRMIKLRHPDDDWSLLTTLRPGAWEPNDGWKPKVPRRLPYVIASRHLLLRYNHPYGKEEQEVSPGEAIDRAEVAYMLREALTLSEWEVDGLAAYKAIRLPTLSKRQRQILSFALQYVGYPYVWAGEYPSKGFALRLPGARRVRLLGLLLVGHEDPLQVPHQRQRARRRLHGAERQAEDLPQFLKAGDLIFFADSGTRSNGYDVYHAAIYMGRGWFVHSTGSSDGVTIDSLDQSTYWSSHFAWGRRLLTKAELAIQ